MDCFQLLLILVLLVYLALSLDFILVLQLLLSLVEYLQTSRHLREKLDENRMRPDVEESYSFLRVQLEHPRKEIFHFRRASPHLLFPCILNGFAITVFMGLLP